MLQIATEVLRNPDDKTDVSLIFGNVSDKDILLKKEIDDMARKHPNFHVRSFSSGLLPSSLFVRKSMALSID